MRSRSTVFFGAVRTPRVRAGREADPRGERGPNGRSPRVCSSYTAVVANARRRLRSEGSKPVNRKRPAYVTCPMRHDSSLRIVHPPRGGPQRVRWRPASQSWRLPAAAAFTRPKSPRREAGTRYRLSWRSNHQARLRSHVPVEFVAAPAIETHSEKQGRSGWLVLGGGRHSQRVLGLDPGRRREVTNHEPRGELHRLRIGASNSLRRHALTSPAHRFVAVGALALFSLRSGLYRHSSSRSHACSGAYARAAASLRRSASREWSQAPGAIRLPTASPL